jgi:hypothetical protein
VGEDGRPVFAEPVSVLQENADLYAGTLPSPTTVDWNGDGVLDILAGNSEGFVLFFENIGSNDEPKFLPATRVQAGGREIQVQAGYSGSLQGFKRRAGAISRRTRSTGMAMARSISSPATSRAIT